MTELEKRLTDALSRGMQSRGGQETHKLPQKTNPAPPRTPLTHRVGADCKVREVRAGGPRPLMPSSVNFQQSVGHPPWGSWQAKDVSRVICTADPERHGIELSLLRRVSQIEWDNIVLYGEYVLNRRLVRRSRSRP